MLAYLNAMETLFGPIDGGLLTPIVILVAEEHVDCIIIGDREFANGAPDFWRQVEQANASLLLDVSVLNPNQTISRVVYHIVTVVRHDYTIRHVSVSWRMSWLSGLLVGRNRIL